MKERIIFDLDDTLIIFDYHLYDSLIPTFNELGIYGDNNIVCRIQKALETYENLYNFYSEENIMNHINKYLNMNLPKEFINVWLKYLGLVEPYNKEYNENAKETLKYLKQKKYELVVLTNWFASSQAKRLEIAELYDYFDEVIGTEKILNKPNKEAFIKACGSRKIEECIMIGDNLDKDIKGAEGIGMDTILCDYRDSHKVYQKTKIRNIIELKEMF